MRRSGSKRRHGGWWRLLLALTGIGATGALQAAPAAGDFPDTSDQRASSVDIDRPSAVDIAPVSERPTLPTAGPFFDVDDIEIEGIGDRPEIDLSVAELVEVAKAELLRQANAQEIADQGYADDELLQVARYLDRVEGERAQAEAEYVNRCLAQPRPGFETESEEERRARCEAQLSAEPGTVVEDFTQLALMEELLELLSDFRARRGINVFNLGEVAQRVEDSIRSKGLILAQVVVPPQTVRDGSVTLRVYPGQLDEVVVAENEVVEAKPLVRAFADVVQQPVLLSEIDERLRLANDRGGIDVTGVFVPGRAPGETQLRLDTVDERKWAMTQRIDNHGTKITGRTRGLAAISIFDLTGAGDDLTLTGLRSEGPNEVKLLNAQYYRPLPGLRQFVTFGISRNEFVISGAADIVGDTVNTELGYGNYWMRRRDMNLTQTVFVVNKDSELNIGDQAAGDRSQVIGEMGTTLTYDALIEGWRAVVDGSSTLRFGVIRRGRFEGTTDPTLGTFGGQPQDFVIASQRLRLFKLFDFDWPILDWNTSHSLLVNINAQYSDQFLPAVNRIQLGGANGVRSLVADDISVDKGVIANFNVYMTVPEFFDFELPLLNQRFVEAVRPFVFYDYGYGVTNATDVDASTQDDTWFEFAGYGVGLEYNLFKDARGDFDIRGSITWAFPEKSRFGDPLFETVIEDEDRIYAEVSIDIDQNDWPFWGGRAQR